MVSNSVFRILYLVIILLSSINKAICSEIYLESNFCSLSNSTETLIKEAIEGNFKAYKELELSSEFGQTEDLCMSECELFMYSLDIALETGNKKAFNTLCKVLEQKYASYSINPNELSRYLLECFESQANVTPTDKVQNKIEWSENDLKYYKNIKPFYYSILHDKDTLAYNSISDSLILNCGREDYITSSYNIAGYIVFSIIMADMYGYAEAYYNVYRLTQDYYLTRGLNMGNKVYEFCLFFIEKAALLGDDKSKRLLEEMGLIMQH